MYATASNRPRSGSFRALAPGQSARASANAPFMIAGFFSPWPARPTGPSRFSAFFFSIFCFSFSAALRSFSSAVAASPFLT